MSSPPQPGGFSHPAENGNVCHARPLLLQWTLDSSSGHFRRVWYFLPGRALVLPEPPRAGRKATSLTCAVTPKELAGAWVQLPSSAEGATFFFFFNIPMGRISC
uniref:Uncharacterized protein n=1 Tax=Otus sunia TaxID=257818 RepID=A0A8C8B1U2_9STRI